MLTNKLQGNAMSTKMYCVSLHYLAPMAMNNNYHLSNIINIPNNYKLSFMNNIQQLSPIIIDTYQQQQFSKSSTTL